MAALFAVLALIIAACGGDEPEETDPAAEEGEAGNATDTDGQGGSEADEGAEGEAGDDDPMEALHQEALDAGGEVVVYSHLTAPEPREAIFNEFEERFPGLTVKDTGKQGQAILEQFLTEKRSGLDRADVFQYPGKGPFLFELVDEEFIEPYTPQAAEAYQDEATYVEDVAYPWYSYFIGAVYNPTTVTEEEIELLKTYEGWADPVWNGRVAMVGPTGGSTSRSLFYWAEEDPDLGYEWLEKLAAHDPTVYSSVTPAAERVIAGEHDVSFNNLPLTAARQHEFGAPLRAVYPEYSVASPALMALVSDAPNPAGGKLLIEWLLSKEGQTLVQEHTKGDSARNDMGDTPVIDADWWPSPPELVAPDEELFKPGLEDMTERFVELFGGWD